MWRISGRVCRQQANMLPEPWCSVALDAEALLRTHAQVQAAARESRAGWSAHAARTQKQQLQQQLQQQALTLLRCLSDALASACGFGERAAAACIATAKAQHAQHEHAKQMPTLRSARRRVKSTTIAVDGTDALDLPASQLAQAGQAGSSAAAQHSLSHADRQELLQLLAPAMSCLYTIDDDVVVCSCLQLFQTMVPRVLCPLAAVTANQQTGPTAAANPAHTLGTMHAGAWSQAAEATTAAELPSCLLQELAMILDQPALTAAAAAAHLGQRAGSTADPLSAGPPYGPSPTLTPRLLQAQLAGLLAAQPALQLLLPLAATFQATTGVRPLGSQSTLPLLCSGANSQDASLSFVTMAFLAVTALAALSAGVQSEVGVERSVAKKEEQLQEAQELCACLHMLWAHERSAWLQQWKRQLWLQQQQLRAGNAQATLDPSGLLPHPSLVTYQLWLAVVQDAGLDNCRWQGHDSCCSIMFQALRSCFLSAGGSDALLAAAILRTVSATVNSGHVAGLPGLAGNAVRGKGPQGPSQASTLRLDGNEEDDLWEEVEDLGLAQADKRGKRGRNATKGNGKGGAAAEQGEEDAGAAGMATRRLLQVLGSFRGMPAVLCAMMEHTLASDAGSGGAKNASGIDAHAEMQVSTGGVSAAAAARYTNATGAATDTGAGAKVCKASEAAQGRLACTVVLALLRTMYHDDAQLLLSACCQLLAPESSCPLEVRLALVAEMRATAAKMDDQQEAQGTGNGLPQPPAPELWTPSVVHALLFSAMHDPAVRVRRALMQLLSYVALPVGSPLGPHLAKVLLAKSRDKDTVVQQRALEMVVQLPMQVLSFCCDRHDWGHVIRCILCCLAGMPITTSAAGAEEGGVSAGSTQGKAYAAKNPPSPGFVAASAHLLRSVLQSMMPATDAATAQAQAQEGAAAAEGDLACFVHGPLQLLLSLGLTTGVANKALLKLKVAQLAAAEAEA